MIPLPKNVCYKLLVTTLFTILIFVNSLNTMSVLADSANGFKSVREIADAGLIEKLVSFIDYERVESHIRKLSSISRFTGYPGCLEAADYIKSQLESYGLKPFFQNYSVIVPVDGGATLTTLDQNPLTLKIYPMLPNLACPPATPGLEGRLVYAGKGTLKELNGLPLNGSVVILDFNSGYNWLDAAQFGAKAFLFIEPDETKSYEAESKRIYAPVNIPRFYILREEAEKLLQRLNEAGPQGLSVFIQSKMTWETKEAQNVIALVKGQLNETIAIFSFYDAFSPVPSLAYDADAASGVAIWLEIARYFSINKPLRNVLFVSFSGHFQTLAGGRAFVDEYIFGEKPDPVLGYRYGRNIKLALGLDISTDSPSACIAWGTSAGNSLIQIGRAGYAYIRDAVKPIFYEEAPGVQTPRDEELTSILQEPINKGSLVYYVNRIMGEKTGYLYMIGDRISQVNDYIPMYPLARTPYMRLESQLIVQVGGIGLTVHTSVADRIHWGLPISNLNKVNMRNLRPQAEFSLCLAYLYIWLDPQVLNQYVNIPGWTKWDGTGLGWPIFEGKILEFDKSLGKYVEVPNALIMFFSWRTPYFEIVLKSDEKGSYRATGFQGAVGGSPVTSGGGFVYYAFAFVINETNGNVEYAPDSGVFGAMYGQSFQYWLRSMGKEVEQLNIPVFKCGSIVLHGLLDPRLMNVRTSFKTRINDAFSHAELIAFSDPSIFTDCYLRMMQATIATGTPAAESPSITMVVFVPPRTPIEVLLYIGPTLVGAFNNGGNGFTVEPGRVIRRFAPMQIASDILLLNERRLNTLHTHGVFSIMNVSEARQSEALRYLEIASNSLSNLNYEECSYYIYKSWNYVAESYTMIKDMYLDTINSVAFISVLSLLFSILLERLIFSSGGFKRAFIIIFIFISITTLCSVLHPGYLLASNIGLELLGISVILMLIPAIMLLLSMASRQLSQIREERRGIEAPAVDKLSAFILSLSYGSSSMRKRPFRVSLTLSSIIAIAFAISLLTSISSYSWTNIIPESVEAELIPYNGYMLRTTDWSLAQQVPQGLSVTLVKYLESQFHDAVVAPRVLSPIVFNVPWYNLLWVDGMPKNITSSPVRAIMGLSVAESKLVNNWNNSIMSGRWLESDEGFECLVSSDIATYLDIKLNQTIRWSGTEFRVVGIFDPSKIGRDIDGEPMTPRDFQAIMQAGSVSKILPYVPRLNSSFIIVPWKTLWKLGGEIMSIAVKPSKVEPETAAALALETGAHVFTVATINGRPTVLKYSKTNVITTSGFDYLLIPLVIGTLIIANTMLGGIYERRKDIFTFSVVGLSLTQIFFMFMAEAIVYGTIGAFLGYLVAMSVAFLSSYFQWGVVFNFTSGYVILALAIAMLAILVAMSLPFLSVAQIATPSLERKWKVPAPKGDHWDVRFPFLIAEEEFNGFLLFMKEYIENQSGDVLGIYNLRSIEVKTVEVPSGGQERALRALMDLLPPELGISQEVLVAGTWDPQRTRYSLHVVTNRISGTPADWMRRNTLVLNLLRKRFLLWKSLTPKEKSAYLERAHAS